MGSQIRCDASCQLRLCCSLGAAKAKGWSSDLKGSIYWKHRLAQPATKPARFWTQILFLLVVYCIGFALLSGVFELTASISDVSAGGHELSLQYRFEFSALQQWFSGLSWSSPERWIGLLIGMLVLCLCLLPLFSLSTAAFVTLIVSVACFGAFWMVEPAADFSVASMFVWILAMYVASLVCRYVQKLSNQRKVAGVFQQYVPRQLTEHYKRNPSEIGAQGVLQEVTVMFCDIRDFTSISEKMQKNEPGDLPGWLDRFFSAVGSVVVRNNGTIDKYMGDSVMAFWGAPEKTDTHARDALKAAVEILAAVESLSVQMLAEGLPPIRIGIGVSTGRAHVGSVGSRHRRAYTVFGDVVNTADRLQNCTKEYKTCLLYTSPSPRDS